MGKKEKEKKKDKSKKEKDKGKKDKGKNGKSKKSAAPEPVHQTFTPGQSYADGTPMDNMTYLEAKLILKPDRFTSVQAFRDFGKLVQKTAKKVGVGFIADAEAGLRPQIREITFGDTPDFRLYNNAFILRRRIAYVDGFPVGDPEIVFKFRHPDEKTGDCARCAAQYRRQVSDQIQGRSSSAEGPGRRLSHPLFAQLPVRIEPDARG